MFEQINVKYQTCKRSDIQNLFGMNLYYLLPGAEKHIDDIAFEVKKGIVRLNKKDPKTIELTRPEARALGKTQRKFTEQQKDEIRNNWRLAAYKCYNFLWDFMKGAMCSYCGDHAEERWGNSKELNLSPIDLHGWSQNCHDYIKNQYKTLREINRTALVVGLFIRVSNKEHWKIMHVRKAHSIVNFEKRLPKPAKQKKILTAISECGKNSIECLKKTNYELIDEVFAFSTLTKLDLQYYKRVMSSNTAINQISGDYDKWLSTTYRRNLYSKKEKSRTLIKKYPNDIFKNFTAVYSNTAKKNQSKAKTAKTSERRLTITNTNKPF